MKLFVLTDKTTKQRRNLIIVSSLICAIKYFDISIKKFSTGGLELDGLNTEVVIYALAAIMFYLGVTYYVSLYEEILTWYSEQLEYEIKEQIKFNAGVHEELDAGDLDYIDTLDLRVRKFTYKRIAVIDIVFPLLLLVAANLYTFEILGYFKG